MTSTTTASVKLLRNAVLLRTHLANFLQRIQREISLPIQPHEAKARIFNDSIRTAKKTHLFTITHINRLTQFKAIIAVYSKDHTKHMNKKAELSIVKADDNLYAKSQFLCTELTHTLPVQQKRGDEIQHLKSAEVTHFPRVFFTPHLMGLKGNG
jgi:hypothetical protein